MGILLWWIHFRHRHNHASSFKVEFTLKSPSQIMQEEWNQHVIPSMQIRKTENYEFQAMPSIMRMLNITFIPDTLGIWSLKYRITTLDNITIKTGVLHFAISIYEDNPNGWTYRGLDLTFTLNSDKERYFYGEMQHQLSRYGTELTSPRT